MGYKSSCKASVYCPKCGFLVTDFQADDAECRVVVTPYDVNEFGGNCPRCKCYLECTVEKVVKIESLDIIVRARNHSEKKEDKE